MVRNPIYIDLPRRDVTLILPQLRDIVVATLAAEGYGERPEQPVQYRPEVGWSDREGISIRLLPPLPGQILGEWVQEYGVSRLMFSLVELQATMSGGVLPFAAPATIVPPYTVFRIGFDAPPPAPLAEPGAAVIMPRERAINLDDW